MASRVPSMSLLGKTLLSTSIALTALFAITGWIMQDNAIRVTSVSLEDEVRASFQAYDSLWRSRAERLASLSLLLSRMSDVRAAFSTRDQATIKDSAKELWGQISREDAVFLVTDPRGRVIASLGGALDSELQDNLLVVRSAEAKFPGQASGFMMSGTHLYQIVVTPVYVHASGGPGLLNVLVAGYVVDEKVAKAFKEAAGGSEFLFRSGGRIVASTLDPSVARQIESSRPPTQGLQRIQAGGVEYTMLGTPLPDVQGETIGQLYILRSFAKAREHIMMLRRNIVLIWLLSVLVGIGLTYSLARRVLGPVQELDRGASEVAHGNYAYRVPIKSDDELGRLGEAFNAMCASIQDGQQELIRRERISTIARLSTSIVHDLRNPLAAIYGGAEMLIDSELSPPQVQRLAGNIYRSSRRMQELLQELVDVGRGASHPSEVCRLKDIVSAAYEVYADTAQAQSVAVHMDVPENIELPLERARMERVFLNLIDNALGAMPQGGSLEIAAETSEEAVLVKVQDTGPGIAPQIRPLLFQPFVTAGKKNGVGLGLALSHQTVLDHGGELWADAAGAIGARFFIKLPWGSS